MVAELLVLRVGLNVCTTVRRLFDHYSDQECPAEKRLHAVATKRSEWEA